MEFARRVADEPVLVDEAAHEVDARGVEGVRRVKHQNPPAGRAVERVVAD